MSDITVSIKNQAATSEGSPAYLTIGESNAVTVQIGNESDHEICLTTKSALTIDFTPVQVDTGDIDSADNRWKVQPYQGSLYLIPLAEQPLMPQESVSIQLTNVSTSKGETGAYSLIAQPAGIDNVTGDSIPVTLSLRPKEVAGDKPLSFLVSWQDGGRQVTVPIGTKVIQTFTLDTNRIALPNELHKTALFISFDEGSGQGQMPAADLSLNKRHYYGLSWNIEKQDDPRTGWKLWVAKPYRTHQSEIICSDLDPALNDEVPPEVAQLNRGQLPRSILSMINSSQVTVSPNEEQANEWVVTEPDATYELVYEPQSQRITIWKSQQLLFREVPNNKLELELILDIPEGTQPGVAELNIEWSHIPGHKSGGTVLLIKKHAPYITKADMLELDGKTPARHVIPQPNNPFTYVVDITDGPVDVKFKFTAAADALRVIDGVFIGDGSTPTRAGRPTKMTFTIATDAVRTSDGTVVHNLADRSAESPRDWFHQVDIQALQGSMPLETHTLRFICVRFQPPFGKGNDEKNNLKGLYLAGYDFTGDVEKQNVEYYEIKKGDTLQAISKEFYGNGTKYTKIFEANREVIKDPHLIFPGQKIRIPDVNSVQRSLKGADLSNANLVGAILRGIDMSEINLSHTDLSGAQLAEANLSLANLRQTRNFDKAKGVTAKDNMVWQLVTMGLKNSGLKIFDTGKRSQKDFSQVDLSGVDLHHVNLGGVDLRGSDLRRTDLSHTRLHGAILDESTKLDAKWYSVWQIVNGKADKRTLAGKNLSESNLHSADLTNADLKGTNLSGANLVGAKFRGAELDGADLRHVYFGPTDFGHVDLTRAILGWNGWLDTRINDETSLDEKWRTVWKIANLGVYFADSQSEVEGDDWDLAKHDLSDCLLQQVNLRGADLHAANLSRSSLLNVDLRKASLSAARLIDADLTGSDLGGASLAGADLTGANLSHVNLRGTKLVGPDRYKSTYKEAQIDSKWRLVWEIVNGQVDKNALRQADLSNADLRKGNLRDVDLRGTDLRGTFLDGADLLGSQIDDDTQIDAKWRMIWAIVNRQVKGNMLSGQDLRWSDLQNANLVGVDLQGTNLSQTNLRGAILDRANLDAALLNSADLSEANLLVTSLKGADLSYVNLNGAHLAKADLTRAKLFHADLRSTDLTGAILTGTDWRSADLAGADLTGADLRGTDLSGSMPYGVKLRDNKYDEHTQWPEDFDPKAHGGQYMETAKKPTLTKRPLRRKMRKKLDPDSGTSFG